MEPAAVIGVVLFVLVVVLAKSVRIVNEYERCVIFRLGRVQLMDTVTRRLGGTPT